ncbi:MAG: RNA polymerase sigma factor [Crocinitomicaceae bacterium]|nr:RNA polymerase sigma factor [Crocinitomicaceae bacterium]
MGKYTNITVELISECANNDRKAQETLYEVCFRFLMPLCMRYNTNEEDARATFNIGFMKILKNIGSIEPEIGSFIAWSRRIMNNTLIDEYRKNKNYKERVTSREHDRELEFHSNNTSNQAYNDFNENSVLRLLEYLKPATKQVFVLYVIEGYNHREIGDLLKMSEGTSKWHLSTARKELQALLEQQEKNNRSRIAI